MGVDNTENGVLLAKDGRVTGSVKNRHDNLVYGGIVTVTKDGSPATLYATRRLTSTVTNPVVAEKGYFEFFLAPGDYTFAYSGGDYMGSTETIHVPDLDPASGAGAPSGSSGAAIGARIRRTTPQTIPDATLTALIFDAERWDTDNFFSVGQPTRLTIPAGQAGKYLASMSVQYAAGGVAGLRELALRLNGTTYYGDHAAVDTTNAAFAVTYPALVLAVGDYIEFVAQQVSGGPLDLTAADAFSFEASLVKVGS